MPASSGLQTLLDFGILNETALSRLADLIRGIQGIAGNFGTNGTVRRRRGRPVGSGARRRGRMRSTGRRGRPKLKRFDPSKAELKTMRKTMAIREIAEKNRVSAVTVQTRLRKHGLMTRRKK